MRRFEIPLRGPDFTVVRENLSIDHSGLAIREQFIPPSAPDIIVTAAEIYPRRVNSRVGPKQIYIVRLINDLVDSCSKFGKNSHPQEPVLKNHGS